MRKIKSISQVATHDCIRLRWLFKIAVRIAGSRPPSSNLSMGIVDLRRAVDVLCCPGVVPVCDNFQCCVSKFSVWVGPCPASCPRFFIIYKHRKSVIFDRYSLRHFIQVCIVPQFVPPHRCVNTYAYDEIFPMKVVTLWSVIARCQKFHCVTMLCAAKTTQRNELVVVGWIPFLPVHRL